jgi:hypothetical protein
MTNAPDPCRNCGAEIHPATECLLCGWFNPQDREIAALRAQVESLTRERPWDDLHRAAFIEVRSRAEKAEAQVERMRGLLRGAYLTPDQIESIAAETEAK